MSSMQPNPPPGQMMNRPLLISSLLRHADQCFGSTEIVSRRVEGDIHRYTYRDCHRRCRRLANVLAGLGVEPGQRVATLAWNGYRHLELYYAVSGSGAVIHTVNPRLHPEQIAYLLNHAEDQYVFFDLDLLDLVSRVAPRCPGVRGYVMLCGREQMPAAAPLAGLSCYEDLLAAAGEAYDWPELDENTASGLCYTSGTTGPPKGVLYTQRSTVLHAYAAALPDALNLSARETVLPVVPMFHVNAWGLPYAAPLTGAKLVLPGPALDGASLHALFEAEGVTSAAGVPTVWLGLLDCVEQNGLAFSAFRRTVVGGAACPPALMRALRERHGIDVVHAWGMTELSPLGTSCTLRAAELALPQAARDAILESQGNPVFGIELKIIDAQGVELPWDGQARGDLLARGPWVADGYYRGGESQAHPGWFATGDIASIDVDGRLRIRDRSKDVIKSGGEWISSIELENIAMSHPAVAEAACIAVPHPKWGERPLLVVVPRAGMNLSRDALLALYEGRIAKWWIPDDVVCVERLPMGVTGKVLKHVLRERFNEQGQPMG